jgi:hypothetical protein
MLGAQQLAPGLASAYTNPYESLASRYLQGGQLQAGIGSGYTNLLTAGTQAGTGMQDALTRMAGVLGDYGRTSADATQAGTSALAAAGNLQAGSYDRILQALGLQSQHTLGQGQLANSAAGINAQAAGMLPSLLNSLTGASTAGASGQLDVARYMSALGEGNINRPWQAWQQSQTYPFLDPAINFLTGQPAPTQMPVIPTNNGGSFGANVAATGTSFMASILPLLIAASSRELKNVISELNYRVMLERLRKVEVYHWQYKEDNTDHIGPMAEDFKEAFGVGDGKTIAYIDAIGVLFATVKGLAAEIANLREQLLPEVN